MAGLKTNSLPGRSRLFEDYVGNSVPGHVGLPHAPDFTALLQRADTVRRNRVCAPMLTGFLSAQADELQLGSRSRENIGRLAQPGTVAVLVSVPASLFGGSMSSVLKCLAAARLAQELESAGIPAVPVCLVENLQHSAAIHPLSVTLLDAQSKLQEISLAMVENGLSDEANLPAEISALIEQVSAIAGGHQTEALVAILRRTYVPEVCISTATACFWGRLLDSWGPVIVDTSHVDYRPMSDRALRGIGLTPEQIRVTTQKQGSTLHESGYAPPETHSVDDVFSLCALLPIAAHIVTSSELSKVSLVFPLFRECGLDPPLLWPHAEATLLDARSRKTLGKNQMHFEDLFAGDPSAPVVRSCQDRMNRVMARLHAMIEDIKNHMAQLCLALENEGDREDTAAAAVEEKMLYQMTRLRDRVTSGAKSQAEVLARQIERTRNTLAPDGHLQTTRLSGLYFLLRYSPAILDIVYQKLDVLNFEHQLIAVD